MIDLEPADKEDIPSPELSAFEGLRLAGLLAEKFAPREVVTLGAGAETLRAALISLGIPAREFSENATAPDALFFWLKHPGDADEQTISRISTAAGNAAGARVVFAFAHDASPRARPAVTRAFFAAGWWPDYAADLTLAPVESVALSRTAPAAIPELLASAELQITRLTEAARELDHRLAARRLQLEKAQARIVELDAKKEKFHTKWEEARDKLAAAREQLAAWERAATGFFGKRVRAKLPRKKEPAKTAAAETASSAPRPYHDWFLDHRATPDALAAIQKEAAAFPTPPRLSLGVIGADAEALRETVASLQAQVYGNWKLLVAAPAPDSDARIRTAPDFGGTDFFSGDWIGFLRAGDVLEPDALFAVAQLLQGSPEAEIVYSDHDEIDAAGKYREPFFKPDWSPETFLSINFLHGFTLLRRELFERAGGLRAGESGSAWDYDLFLRATEHTRAIFHIPRVLFHERAGENSATLRDAVRAPALRESSIHALRGALERRGIEGEILHEPGAFWLRTKRKIRVAKKISIIIPNRDRLELLSRCVASIVGKTDYPDYEIVIVDNDSQQAETLRYYRTLPHRVLHYGGPFNYSAINNHAVRNCDGEWILLLNNDMEIIHADWLSAMAEFIQDEEVGAVGAKLLFPGDYVQHAGVIVGFLSGAGHAFKMAHDSDPGVYGQARMIRNYSAVTAACLLTRRDVWEKVGGLGEVDFPVSLNDIDLCLKIRALGLRVVYTPYARLYHYESASRGKKFDPGGEVAAFQKKWAHVIARDPFYNPNLTFSAHDFSPREEGELALGARFSRPSQASPPASAAP